MNDENMIVPYDFSGEGDGIDLVATPTAATARIAFMRFIKGNYLLGMEKENVPLGTEFLVRGASEGWVRLVKNEPVQRIPRQPGVPFPTRAELGDDDDSKWPLFDGKPSDPWCLSNELLLTERQTGRAVIFTTTSFTGREAVSDLCRLITYHRRSRGAQAKSIVAIGVGMANFGRGPVAIPKFTIADWLDSEAEPEPEPKPPSPLQNDLTEHLQGRSVLSGTEKSTASVPRRQRKKSAPKAWDDDNDLNDTLPW